MSSSTRLFFISLFLVALASVLFYQGFQEEIIRRQTAIVPPSPIVEVSLPEEKVLGEETKETTSSGEINQQGVLVTKVVDGDTIEVNIDNKLYKVRLIGVDTPETVHPSKPVQCFGKEASNETKRMLTGKKVILEKDVSETDKYDRILRYVYIPQDNGQNLFFNDYLVREGYAQVLTYPPDVKFNDRFLEAQRYAKENKKGLWGKC